MTETEIEGGVSRKHERTPAVEYPTASKSAGSSGQMWVPRSHFFFRRGGNSELPAFGETLPFLNAPTKLPETLQFFDSSFHNNLGSTRKD
jgi:hypothetical protein